jgi:Zn-dependent peptidase ImmA (M78 family)
MVVASKLQSGARNVAESRGLGIAKFDQHGLEIVADRKGGTYAETSFVKSQIFQDERPSKSLKFSAYGNGRFFSTVAELLSGIEPEHSHDIENGQSDARASVPYVSAQEIKNLASAVLTEIDYQNGPVDLAKICSVRGIQLKFVDSGIQDIDGLPILGTANFTRNLIQVYAHDDSNRERFTIGHEIGHFFLGHDRYLKSDTFLERDLLTSDEPERPLNYERLEYQANTFAADILLPDKAFIYAMAVYRSDLQIRYRGHGYIYVDNQPDNLLTYQKFLTLLSTHFEVSKLVVEIKLKKMNWLNDQRKPNHAPARPPLLAFPNLAPNLK